MKEQTAQSEVFLQDEIFSRKEEKKKTKKQNNALIAGEKKGQNQKHFSTLDNVLLNDYERETKKPLDGPVLGSVELCHQLGPRRGKLGGTEVNKLAEQVVRRGSVHERGLQIARVDDVHMQQVAEAVQADANTQWMGLNERRGSGEFSRPTMSQHCCTLGTSLLFAPVPSQGALARILYTVRLASIRPTNSTSSTVLVSSLTSLFSRPGMR
jgi:hypothetical protein